MQQAAVLQGDINQGALTVAAILPTAAISISATYTTFGDTAGDKVQTRQAEQVQGTNKTIDKE